LAGLQLQPAFDADGNMAVMLVAIGGRHSDLVPFKPRAAVIAKVAELPLVELRKLLDEPQEANEAAG
jgi:hypothetical protein